MKFFKKYFTKQVKMMILASIVITLLFFLYLYFVGIPLTNANNYLNQGIRYYEAGDYDKAKTELSKSLNLWYSEAADGYLKKTEEKINPDVFLN